MVYIPSLLEPVTKAPSGGRVTSVGEEYDEEALARP